ncbi:MAG: hypothetical protein U0169_15855 [Polyangiaceae bacterium]
MMRTGTATLVVSTLVLAACGGAPEAGSTKTPDTASSAAATPAAMSKLGHFSTADGMIHLVIDRTGDKAKIQMDGSPDVVELTQEEVRARQGGELLGYAFLKPDGTRALFIGTGGNLLLVKGETDKRMGDELPLVRDADAKPLGVATIKGAPPGPKAPEKSKSDVEAEALASVSVVKRFPKFKPEDSGDLAKVAEAFELATADMMMHATEDGGAWYAPVGLPDGKGGLGFVREKDLRQGPASEGEKKAPLAKFNAWLRPDYEFGDWTHDVVKSSWLAIYQFDFKQLQPKTTVLVWNVDGSDVFVVTPDGSRYWDSPMANGEKPTFAKGMTPVAEWPAPLRNNLLFREHVIELGKRGLVDKKAADEFESIHAKWGECAKKTFVGAQKELEGNLTNSPHPSAGSAKNDLVRRKYNEKAVQACGAKRAEKLLVEMLAKREKDQRALFEKTKARLATSK